MFRTIVIKLAIGVGSVVLSLLLVEGMLRVIQYTPLPYSWEWAVRTYFRLHPVRIYSLVDHAKSPDNDFENIDAKGFRYDEHDDNQMTSKTTVVVFGDSFVYGYPLRDNEPFPFIAQQLLTKQGLDVDIVNAGVPGYGFDQVYEYIREVMNTYQPRIIVWGVNVNDLNDSNEACLYKSIQGQYVRLPIWAQTLSMQGYVVREAPEIIKRSYFVNVVLRYMQQGHSRYALGCTIPEDRQGEIAQNGVNKLRYFMEELAKETKKRGIKVMYALLPAEYYFHTSEYPNAHIAMTQYFALRDVLHQGNDAFIDFNQLIAERLFPQVLVYRESSVSATHIDISGESTENPDALFLEGDVIDDVRLRHPNATGAALLGELFARALVDVGL